MSRQVALQHSPAILGRTYRTQHMTDAANILTGAIHDMEEYALTTDDCHKIARSCLSALSQGGYAVVKREPTQAMLDATPRSMSEGTSCEAWSAMLSAGEVKPSAALNEKE